MAVAAVQQVSPAVGVNPCSAYFSMSPTDDATARKLEQKAGQPVSFYQGHGWEVTTRDDTTILDAKSMDCWSSELGVSSLPDMIYAHSVATLRHVASGTTFHFDAHDALRAAALGWRSGGADDSFKCEFASAWEHRAPQGQKYSSHDHGIDWTYRTPYSGSLRRVASVDAAPAAVEGGEIDWELLKDRGQPILHFTSLELYEDELADMGRSKLSLKLRFQPTCWFVLLRQFIRVDRVRVWIRDVRLFHKRDTRHVVEEVTVRSMSISDMSGKAEDLAATSRAMEAGVDPPRLRTYNNIDELAQTTPVVKKTVRSIPL